MEWLDRGVEAAVHRIVARALLKGALADRGSARAVAAAAGVTPQYLSALLRPDDPEARIWLAGPLSAAKIARALPIDRAQQEEAFAHVLLGSERRLRQATRVIARLDLAPEERYRILDHLYRAGDAAQRAARAAAAALLAPDVAEAMHALRHANHWGIHDADHLRSTAARQTAFHGARMLAATIDARRCPEDFAELCLLVGTIGLTLHTPGTTLAYAQLGQHLLRTAPPVVARARAERRDDLRFNLIIMEASAYHHLGAQANFQRARACHLRAEREASFVRDPARNVPLLAREMIPTITRLRRFALADITTLADRVAAVCERGGLAEPEERIRLLVDRGVASAYVKVGSLQKADRLLAPYAAIIEDSQIFPTIHQVMYDRTVAQLAWKTGERDRWGAAVERAIRRAAQADLRHQLASIRHNFGAAVDDALARVAARPPGSAR